MLALRAIQALDRLRLGWLRARHPGLDLDSNASSNLAHARYALAPGANLRIGAGVVTERLRGRLHFDLGPGARVEIGEGAWLRQRPCLGSASHGRNDDLPVEAERDGPPTKRVVAPLTTNG